MRRRAFLRFAAKAGMLSVAAQRATLGRSSRPILDAHVHLFDPTRRGGVPWPEKTDTAVYKPALPDRLEALAAPLGVVGAIAVEASPMPSDNSWLLEMCARHPFMVGCIGNLDPADAGFPGDLARLKADPLFLGIRYGNLWQRNMAADLDKPGFWRGLEALENAGLVFETANPDARLVHAITRIAQRLPQLRIVIDHLPNATLPADAQQMESYRTDLHLLGTQPQVAIKLSEIPIRRSGRVLTDPNAYRARLDALWDVFGDERVLFGSDWPNSDHVAEYATTLRILREYASHKSDAAQQKLFGENSMRVYRWKPRRAAQRMQR